MLYVYKLVLVGTTSEVVTTFKPVDTDATTSQNTLNGAANHPGSQISLLGAPVDPHNLNGAPNNPVTQSTLDGAPNVSASQSTVNKALKHAYHRFQPVETNVICVSPEISFDTESVIICALECIDVISCHTFCYDDIKFGCFLHASCGAGPKHENLNADYIQLSITCYDAMLVNEIFH